MTGWVYIRHAGVNRKNAAVGGGCFVALSLYFFFSIHNLRRYHSRPPLLGLETSSSAVLSHASPFYVITAFQPCSLSDEMRRECPIQCIKAHPIWTRQRTRPSEQGKISESDLKNIFKITTLRGLEFDIFMEDYLQSPSTFCSKALFCKILTDPMPTVDGKCLLS